MCVVWDAALERGNSGGLARDVSKVRQETRRKKTKTGEARFVANEVKTAQVKNCVLESRRRKFRFLSVRLNTSAGHVHASLRDPEYDKARSQCVPHIVTGTHQEYRVSESLGYLKQQIPV